ncbi:D-amino acid aminotransferase [Rhizobium sp. R72]|uniref:DUF4865 family protein n=1 Tax=unclassified Rhizobium TaxID=2613769 RepID=UPI000B52D8CD|nr:MULTISPECIES: DUF4865 family protein [unclassified Rhizobium]OWV83608.1 D-amino acid aminotransferase [Rhizobium sp. R693]OWW00588.1 D-amino acid aminotransferase [Rhizobium sp. R72]OWW00672.1 D-amino acid aminotransferase [Rhizobium sp. R711]
MMAMQYSFTLPADYDMSIIDRRIRDKGPMLDGFSGLGFKAYLSARKGEYGSRENLYAPFYFWQQPERASDFLTSPGFEGLTQSFGWPQVKTWIVWHAETAPSPAEAGFATEETITIEPYSSLAEIRDEEIRRAQREARQADVVASVSAFEPTNWTALRFSLHRSAPLIAGAGQIYRVGHVSLP